ncbi:MAG: ATP-binding protein [Bryobacteraceae bacterium]|nr:ATP-binding protein [Bryobacteraceae bacterium]MDW8377355.1 ATP-binding protein [Bryobacterales bacterium]
MQATNEFVGVVLGSRESTPLEFWIGVEPGKIVQLDDLIVLQTTLPDGSHLTYYGMVDQVTKRFEGNSFDTDAFHVADHSLPVEVSYAAHVQVTRLDPEVFVPPHPGDAVQVVRGEAYQKALYFDRMLEKIPIGFTRSGEPVYANLEFLDGTRGAHVSISGISGVATKTSYATFLLYSLFHSQALGASAINSKALIFNVKGEDLLWLDTPNKNLSAEDQQAYAQLGLPAGPFQSVRIYAPAKKGVATMMPDTGTRVQGVEAYCWTLRQFAEQQLLRFAFVGAEDERAQLSFIVTRVEHKLAEAAKNGKLDDPFLEVEGERITSFRQLVERIDQEFLIRWAPQAASGTQDAFRRRLYSALEHLGHLIRGEEEAVRHSVNWESQQVTVIDIHQLRAAAQMFVVGAILKKAMEDKERKGSSRPLMFVVLDELNKYAPRTGWSPIRDVLLDIAERGRSLGVSLFGAQQTASEVERRVVANAALRAVGRLDAAEAERDEYRFLTGVTRKRATLLQPGSMIVAQPEIPTPILLRFPFPAWATRYTEVNTELEEESDLFNRMRD